MDIPTHAELVERYETFCKRHDMAETRFGRDATGEPQLLQSIRSGRSPSLKLLQRVASFMAAYEASNTAAAADPSPDNGGENIDAASAEARAA